MTFPIKKRINTEPFVNRKPALYVGEAQIRVGTNEGDQPVAQVDWRIEYTWHRNAISISKGVEMRDQVWASIEMSLVEMWKNQSLTFKYH